VSPLVRICDDCAKTVRKLNRDGLCGRCGYTASGGVIRASRLRNRLMCALVGWR
jgi:hypothetical protein